MALPEETAQLPAQVTEGQGMSDKSPVFNDMSTLVGLMGLDGQPNLNVVEDGEKIAAAPILTGAANATLGQEAIQNQPNEQKSVFDLTGNKPVEQQTQQQSAQQQNQTQQSTPEQVAEQERQRLAEQQNQVPNTNEPAQQVPQDIQTLTAQFETERNGYISEIERLKNENAALSEFNKDPMEFLAKRAPGVIINKFDPSVYVASKMSELYADDFQFNPADAYKPNTDSYKYRKDLERFETEAEGLVGKANGTIQEQTAEEQRIAEEAKNILQTQIATVKTKYGLDDVSFNQKIWKPLSEMKDSDRLEILAEYLMLKEASQNRINNIQSQNAVNRFPSLSNTGAGGNGLSNNKPTDTQKLNDFFGQQQVAVFAGTN